MSKVSESILRGAQQALAHARGEKVKVKIHKVKVPVNVDVKHIKSKPHLN